MGHHTEVFVGIDTSKSRNAIAIADGGRGGEVRYLGEFSATEAAIRKCLVVAPSLVPKKAGDRVKTNRRDAGKPRQAVARGRAHRGVGTGRAP